MAGHLSPRMSEGMSFPTDALRVRAAMRAQE